MTETEKSAYRAAVMMEMERAVMLGRKDLRLQKEEDAAVYAVWYLLNPLAVSGRGSLDLFCGRWSKRWGWRFFRFTAHGHPDEPLEPSPDDMLIYDLTHRKGVRAVHYLADRFRISRLR